MPPVVATCRIIGPRERQGSAGLRALALMVLGLCLALAVRAQGVEVLSLAAQRNAEAVTLDYQLRVMLPRAAEEAALRGVPLYFVATASLYRPRWYWRDDRVGRVRREWRLSYQPLTSTWRVSQGGLGQSHETLDEAMASMTRTSGWRVADAATVEADGRAYLEFEWALDTAQLPKPLQIGLGGVPGVPGSEWALGIERSLRVESAPRTADNAR
jgi:Domain of unknown function (DUF4390)